MIDIEIKDLEWKEFFINDIFSNIQRGKRLIKAKQIKGSIPYISSSSMMNGVDNFIDNNENVRIFSNCLTLANSGSVGSCFFHPYEFIASDHVTKLENKKFNKYIYLFISCIISNLKEKYSFNREISDKRLKKEKIMLPVNSSGNPNWEYMEEFMRNKEILMISKYKEYIIDSINEFKVSNLMETKWLEFSIDDIVDIVSGKDIYNVERIKGKTPYISSTSINNGIGHFVSNNNNTLEAACISVNRNGSVGYSFFHPYSALYSNDCRKLRIRCKSKYVALFITNQITHQRLKYGYGYKMGTGRLKRQKILLPVNINNKPDYNYMENYMKQIECNQINEYLEKINTKY